MTSLLVVSIFQFFDDDPLGIFDECYALLPMPSSFHYDHRSVYLPRLGIDLRTFKSIPYLIAICYASTSRPSFLSSSVIFITRSKSSARSREASSGRIRLDFEVAQDLLLSSLIINIPAFDYLDL